MRLRIVIKLGMRVDLAVNVKYPYKAGGGRGH